MMEPNSCHSEQLGCPVLDWRPADDATPAPTVVCLAGAAVDPLVFEPMAQEIGRRVLAPAWMDTTESCELPAVADRVLALSRDLRSVVLVGQSVGSTVAALAAHRGWRLGSDNPVCGLVLSNGGANNHDHPDLRGLLDRARAEWGPSFWHGFARRCVGTPVPQHLYRAVQGYPAGIPLETFLTVAEGQFAIDLVPLLPDLASLPSAVIAGRYDPARRLAHAEELAQLLAPCELIELETGHTAVLEDPAGFAAVVSRILDDARAPGTT